MGDTKRIREMDRRNTCLHEAAHSVARQLVVGDLGEVVVQGRGHSHYRPIESTRLVDMGREQLATTAVVVAAGMVAERTWCKKMGNQDRAVSDDVRQWEEIRRLGGFSGEEMEALWSETGKLLEAHERAIRRVALELDRRSKLSGEQVSRIMTAHGPRHEREERG